MHFSRFDGFFGIGLLCNQGSQRSSGIFADSAEWGGAALPIMPFRLDRVSLNMGSDMGHHLDRRRREIPFLVENVCIAYITHNHMCCTAKLEWNRSVVFKPNLFFGIHLGGAD